MTFNSVSFNSTMLDINNLSYPNWMLIFSNCCSNYSKRFFINICSYFIIWHFFWFWRYYKFTCIYAKVYLSFYFYSCPLCCLHNFFMNYFTVMKIHSFSNFKGSKFCCTDICWQEHCKMNNSISQPFHFWFNMSGSY